MAGSQGISPKTARRKFAVNLLTLPMDDDDFVAALETEGCFSGDQKAVMKSKATEKGKASYFLDNIIDRSVDMNLKRLLKVMEEFDKKIDGPMNQLASEIKKAMELCKE